VITPHYTKDNLLSVPQSIQARYGAVPRHATLPALDGLLLEKTKNVVLILLDGLGSDALYAHAPDGFLWRNRMMDLTTVYPSTTVAALTSLQSGLSPAEHGWLGWSCYFKEISQCVDLFTNRQSGTDVPAAEGIVAKAIGYPSLLNQLRAADPGLQCHEVSPYSKPAAHRLKDVCKRIEVLCRREGSQYIYAYHPQPDALMHELGCHDTQIKELVLSLDKQMEALCAALKDTLVIITSDHGMTDVDMLDIEDYPQIAECLRAPISRDFRSLSFHVKKEYLADFPNRWQDAFHDYNLMTAQEALHSGLFGPGRTHARFMDFIGDYAAFATGNRALWYGRLLRFKAAHAGLKREEMIVPLIAVRC